MVYGDAATLYRECLSGEKGLQCKNSLVSESLDGGYCCKKSIRVAYSWEELL